MFLVLSLLFCITNALVAFDGSYAAKSCGLTAAKTAVDFLNNHFLNDDMVFSHEIEYISLLEGALAEKTDDFKNEILSYYLHRSVTCSNWRIRAQIAGCIKAGANPDLEVEGRTTLKEVSFDGYSRKVILAKIEKK